MHFHFNLRNIKKNHVFCNFVYILNLKHLPRERIGDLKHLPRDSVGGLQHLPIETNKHVEVLGILKHLPIERTLESKAFT